MPGNLYLKTCTMITQQQYILPRDVVWNLFSLVNLVPKLSQEVCIRNEPNRTLTRLRYSFHLCSAASWEIYKVPLKLMRQILFLPPQTFSLLLDWSSLTSKVITVHPGIIDSDYKGEIQIMMSSQMLWQFKKGDNIAQLLLLPYISINTSNDIQTGGFGNTNQKQSLGTPIVSKYTWPNINIKTDDKRFFWSSWYWIQYYHYFQTFMAQILAFTKNFLPNYKNISNQSTRGLSKCPNIPIWETKRPAYIITALCDRWTP